MFEKNVDNHLLIKCKEAKVSIQTLGLMLRIVIFYIKGKWCLQT